MIEGVTVLNKIPLENVSIVFFILVFIITIIIICFIMADMYFICPISLLCLGLIMAFGPSTPTGEYKYECLIDESVSFNELYKKYEIVEQRGSIWVLKDKKAE